MEYREKAIDTFREEVINDYEEYRKNFHKELISIVGQIVNIAQDIEMKLKELNYIENNTDSSLFKTPTKQLINMLEEKGFFNDKSEFLKRKLINVIDCRNWVIHTGFKEWEGRKTNDDQKIFQSIARGMGLFKANPKPFKTINGKFVSTGGSKELEDNIRNDWQNACNINFNMEEYQPESPTISDKRDWAAVKIVMTKYLMYEFLDVLEKNPLSIYAE